MNILSLVVWSIRTPRGGSNRLLLEKLLLPSSTQNSSFWNCRKKGFTQENDISGDALLYRKGIE